ncbi:2-deoxy-5-keto-D-gluconate 6-phosphate aldolase domain-containing protein [Deinococcus sp.]|uniref:2-deoxy-5-keto-D-gluconate 6-phosphate aldolase domain-containing protein n=1 Tax=Deinococcus sp. TaxID=47478 RepID=UPI003B5B9282
MNANPAAFYILPFDHRDSFEHGLFGLTPPLSAEQTAQVAAAKQLVYDGFLQADVSKSVSGILVDEQFGAAILKDAQSKGILTACPAEKSGQDEFALEYGDDFAAHIEAVNPSYVKVLVRYNPSGDAALNARQRETLAQLSAYLQRTERPLMFELLVPATPAQQGGDYDTQSRPALMVQAIEELQDAGIEPQLWKVEGVDTRENAQALAQVAQRSGRENVKLIVLGRGADDAQVRRWLEVAAAVPGFIGFAVGRTTFWDALKRWRAGEISRDDAVSEIARNYLSWVGAFEAARQKASV